jgi:cyclopropane fatty-acyl-phospholipid synthase-like methyltransferase
VVAHYEARLREFGPSARGVDWKDDASQALRFDVLCDGCELPGTSLLEVGSGVGHLYDHLLRRGADVRYTGIDLSASMVEAARQRLPEVRFERRDLLHWETPETWDAVLCSGLFHVKLDAPDDAWRAFIHEMLRRMYARCRAVVAFNLMSDQVDYRTPGLHYADPGEILDFCRRELSRHVVVRHDYPLYEFSVHVHRHARS